MSTCVRGNIRLAVEKEGLDKPHEGDKISLKIYTIRRLGDKETYQRERVPGGAEEQDSGCPGEMSYRAP